MNLNQPIMPAKDPVDGRYGSAYAIIDGERFLLFQLKNFTADDDIDKLEIPLLGTNKKGFRDGTMTGKWSATLYYNTDKFREIAYKYRKTGVMTYFDLQITNADPNTAAGRHTVILKDCLLDKIPWAKLDIENKVLEEEVSGTYDDVEMPEKFAVLEGMLS